MRYRYEIPIRDTDFRPLFSFPPPSPSSLHALPHGPLRNLYYTRRVLQFRALGFLCTCKGTRASSRRLGRRHFFQETDTTFFMGAEALCAYDKSCVCFLVFFPVIGISHRNIKAVYLIGISHRYLISVSLIGISNRYLSSISLIGISHRQLASVSLSGISHRYFSSISRVGISHRYVTSVSRIGISHRYPSLFFVLVSHTGI